MILSSFIESCRAASNRRLNFDPKLAQRLAAFNLADFRAVFLDTPHFRVSE